MNSGFAIHQYRPSNVESPLKETVRFISDSDGILLDPSAHYDASSTEDRFQGAGEQRPPGIESKELKHQVKLQLAGPRESLFYDPAAIACGIVTCGGVCPGLNNVIRALVNILSYRYAGDV